MFDKHLRQLKEAVLTPVAVNVGRYASPNTISLLAGGAGIACGVAAWQGMYSLGLLLWLLNRTLDGLDGTVARLYNKQTDIGGYLDILVDFTVYASVPALLAVGRSSDVTFAAALFLITTFYVNAGSWLYLSSLLERRRASTGEMTSVVIPGGLIEGTETVVFFVLFFLLPDVLDVLFVMMGVLVWATIVQRFAWALKHL